MKKKDDIQQIHDILSGDDTAFNALVRKYQKDLHAFIWRKIGDFHYAEEIVQDTFLLAYEKISTLRNPNQFAAWLYAIANRRCIHWTRKKISVVQSLEVTSVDLVEKYSYARYISEQYETEVREHRNEIVKNLLERLPKHERKVITLHYLREVSIKEISESLGVPVNTVKSQLQRARKRLQALTFNDTGNASKGTV